MEHPLCRRCTNEADTTLTETHIDGDIEVEQVIPVCWDHWHYEMIVQNAA